ncbi:MAG: L,D-transpeptidase family protein [Methyloceanibacter sp.]|jgi:L,D-transpeptidase YcbB
MVTWKRFGARGAACATLALTAALLITGSAPAGAGLFSWLGGNGQGQDDGSQPPPNRGFFGGRGGFAPSTGGGQYVAPQPGSAAFHGDELPPAEGNDATRAWITNPALGSPTLSTRNIEATKAAIRRYQTIVAQGGWPTVPAFAMRPGSRGEPVELLHRRLEISGDLVGQSIPDEYDAGLTQAVRKFQARHALPPTGDIDRATIDVMNVPAAVRLHQLQSNLGRLQTLAPAAANRYVMVNIPAAQVEAVESGQVASRHAAVVGKPERPTPELSSKIQEIDFNPYWYVPRSIIYKDLVPKAREFAQRHQDMLAAYHMEAFDAAGNPIEAQSIDWFGDQVYGYNYRQLPWEENSLGFVKINFPNKDSVYMHDTPLKSLFGRNVRFESSGCVRVHNVEGLVTWILRDTPGWDMQHVLAMKQSGEQVDVKLGKPVPVYFVYVSAWATPDGVVNFRPDIYDHDGAPETASAAE